MILYVVQPEYLEPCLASKIERMLFFHVCSLFPNLFIHDQEAREDVADWKCCSSKTDEYFIDLSFWVANCYSSAS